MKIVVCIKQVPAAATVKIDPVTSQLIRENVESVLNPFDYYALEAALTLKDALGAQVTALTMGPAKAEAVLREAVALGADQGVLLSDRAFAGSDSWATSYLLSLAIRKLGGVRLVFCGKQAIDGDTAQVGPELAAQLDWVQLTNVCTLELSADDRWLAGRRFDWGQDQVSFQLPAVCSVERELNVPRIPTLKGYLRAAAVPVTTWGVNDLQPEARWIGLAGSPTRVVSSHPATMRQRSPQVFHGDTTAAVRMIQQLLHAQTGEA